MKKILAMFTVLSMTAAMMLPMGVTAAQTNETLLSHLAGDVNGDWTVDSSDVRSIYMVVSGTSNTALPAAADIDGNGIVNIMDAVSTLRTTVTENGTVLVRPIVLETETAPEGETIAFTQANEPMEFANDARRNEDVWIAQSLDELKAIYAHSNSRVDFSAGYTEEFFEDKALIVWASHCADGGLVHVDMNRIVKNGNELCLVRTLYYTLDMPMDWFDRYLLEISKDDLVGIDTIVTYSEREYDNE